MTNEEIDLRTSFYKERLQLQEKQQAEAKALAADQAKRLADFQKANGIAPPPGPAVPRR